VSHIKTFIKEKRILILILAFLSQKLKSGTKSVRKSDFDCVNDEYVLVTNERLMNKVMFHI
jgi:hypothetical protein